MTKDNKLTIDEAIKQLRGLLPHPDTLSIREAFNYEKSVQLGIEALERCKWNYENPQRADLRRLPSEGEK